MTLKKIMKLIALVATVAMVLTFASCSLLKGNLELKSFTVNGNSVKTNYLVGEKVDFSGIKAIAKYSDETLNKEYTYNELTFTFPEGITEENLTETAREVEVWVSFKDPHLNVEQKAKFTVKVTTEPVIEADPAIAIQFEKPGTLTYFEASNKINANLKYGDAGFSSQFAIGGKTYKIGNENTFRFTPRFAVLNEEGTEPKPLDNFFSVVELSVKKDGAYVALTATAGEGNTVSYYDGETLIVTVDTYKGTYTFAPATEGLNVKISVLPSAEQYIFDSFNPVVLEAEIIKAYNIYEAWELAVVDNDNTDERETSADWNDSHVWDEFKTEKGIAGVTVSGIVLHADLHLTTDDVPEAFFMTSDKDIVYTNVTKDQNGNETTETKTIPAGTKYLYDWASIYRHVSTPGETFVIEGNFFSISLANFPLIPSPVVFGQDGVQDDYGSDFSNSDLFRFVNDTQVETANYPKVNVQNLNVIGNAARDSWRDSEGSLVSAGGLIFLKTNRYVEANFDNIIGNSFFITYFTDEYSVMNISNVKCYDSYQNAIYMWADSKMNVVDSYFSGAGGPMAIIASPKIGGAYTSPSFVANNSIFETHVHTQSVWVEAVNGSAIIAGIETLSSQLSDNGLGSLFIKDSTSIYNNTINIQGLLMPEGSDAAVVIGGVDAQGSLSINGKGVNRNQTEDNKLWLGIVAATKAAMSTSGSIPPFLTVYDAAGTAHTVFFDGAVLRDLQNRPIGTDASHQAIMAAFMTSDTIVLTQGGISVVLEFYH